MNPFKEDYYVLCVKGEVARVCGQLVVEQKAGYYRLLNRFTLTFRVMAMRIKSVHIHHSFEYYETGTNALICMDTNSILMRTLLADRPDGQRMVFKSCGKAVFESKKHHVCAKPAQKDRAGVCGLCLGS